MPLWRERGGEGESLLDEGGDKGYIKQKQFNAYNGRHL